MHLYHCNTTIKLQSPHGTPTLGWYKGCVVHVSLQSGNQFYWVLVNSAVLHMGVQHTQSVNAHILLNTMIKSTITLFSSFFLSFFLNLYSAVLYLYLCCATITANIAISSIPRVLSNSDLAVYHLCGTCRL